jgi:putative acetyltransferase
MISVRSERADDIPAIRRVIEEAFGRAREADVVDTLRVACPRSLSLVATIDDAIVGHILFTPAVIETADGMIEGMGLAPVSVHPKQQSQGVGYELIRTGLSRLKAQGCPFVIVLGHPEYYPRYGFERASLHNIRCQWDDVPDEAFMILVMDKTALSGVSGVARYRQEWDQAE